MLKPTVLVCTSNRTPHAFWMNEEAASNIFGRDADEDQKGHIKEIENESA